MQAALEKNLYLVRVFKVCIKSDNHKPPTSEKHFSMALAVVALYVYCIYYLNIETLLNKWGKRRKYNMRTKDQYLLVNFVNFSSQLLQQTLKETE